MRPSIWASKLGLHPWLPVCLHHTLPAPVTRVLRRAEKGKCPWAGRGEESQRTAAAPGRRHFSPLPDCRTAAQCKTQGLLGRAEQTSARLGWHCAPWSSCLLELREVEARYISTETLVLQPQTLECTCGCR